MSTMLALFDSSSLDQDFLSERTLFIPTDAAFHELLPRVVEEFVFGDPVITADEFMQDGVVDAQRPQLSCNKRTA